MIKNRSHLGAFLQMKSWNTVLLCTLLVLMATACRYENSGTHHSIETDGYKLTVSGFRIVDDRQIASIPKDTMVLEFGDTVSLHGV